MCHQATLNPSKKILKSKVWWILGKTETVRGKSLLKTKSIKNEGEPHLYDHLFHQSSCWFRPEGGNFFCKGPDNKYRFAGRNFSAVNT